MKKNAMNKIDATTRGWGDEQFNKFLDTVTRMFSLNQDERTAAREEIKFYTEKCGWTVEEITRWFLS